MLARIVRPSATNSSPNYVQLLTLSSDAQTRLSLPARLVYSVLAYRNRIGLSSSVRELSRDTVLNRRTVTAALSELQALELASKAEGPKGKWQAEPPRSGMFALGRAVGSHWADKYTYTRIGFLPSPTAAVGGKRFEMRHAVLYWTLASFARAKGGDTVKVTNAGLAKILDLDTRTVASALRLLKEAKLINYSQGRSSTVVGVLAAEGNPVWKTPEKPLPNLKLVEAQPIEEPVVQVEDQPPEAKPVAQAENQPEEDRYEWLRDQADYMRLSDRTVDQIIRFLECNPHIDGRQTLKAAYLRSRETEAGYYDTFIELLERQTLGRTG
jgi:DNA-binding transcriptional regulator YhcF (GntR family)